MDEVDSEELVAALEGLMGVFADSIGPYALEIVKKLVSQYQRLVTTDGDSDDDGEGLLAAAGCVTAARRVIDAVSK